jgi:hypothetical protein
MRDYALLLPARGDVRQDWRWGRLAEAGRRPDEVWQWKSAIFSMKKRSSGPT